MVKSPGNQDNLAVLLSGKGVRYGDPNSFSGLTLIPVFHPHRAPFDYTLLAQAVAARTAVIEEVGRGTVPTLRVRNLGERPVLMVDGEHLIGVKQNRILNTTILVPEKSTVDVPVSCVEARRWSAPAGDAKPASPHLFMKTRARKAETVTASVRSSGMFVADQARIWRDVDETLGVLGASAPTAAMHAAYEQRSADVSEFLRHLSWQDGQAGVVAAIGGRIACADIFDRPETLRGLWDRLIPSYAVEAMAETQHGPREGKITAEDASAFVRSALGAHVTRHAAVGLGTDVRLTGDGLVGAGLEVVDATVVHLALFCTQQQSGELRGGKFASVTERQRRKGLEGGDPPVTR